MPAPSLQPAAGPGTSPAAGPAVAGPGRAGTVRPTLSDPLGVVVTHAGPRLSSSRGHLSGMRQPRRRPRARGRRPERHECGLCEARFGDRRAVTRLLDGEEARARGVEPRSGRWSGPSGSCMGSRCARAVAATPRRAPCRSSSWPRSGARRWRNWRTSPSSCVCRRLRAGSTGCARGRCQHHLAFVLKPRHPGGAVSLGEARSARIDLDLLARHLERRCGVAVVAACSRQSDG